MSDRIGEGLEAGGDIERYVRYNVKPTRDSFSYDVTVSVRTNDRDVDIQEELSELARIGRTRALEDIHNRNHDHEDLQHIAAEDGGEWERL